jgi:hypothetical protein
MPKKPAATVPTPLVLPTPRTMTMKETCQALDLMPERVRQLCDEGAIECERDQNNNRLPVRDSVARYLLLKRQNADAKVYRESQRRLSKQIAEGRARRGRP